MPHPRWFFAVVLALPLFAAIAARTASTAPAPDAQARVQKFLGEGIGFDAAQLAAVERGEVVTKVLQTKQTLNVVVFGAVIAHTSRERFVQQALDFKNALRAPTRVQLGFFSTPAAAGDVRTLSLTSQDVKDLKNCKPNDCKLKLPAAGMQRMRNEIDWSGNELGQVNALCRTRATAYVNDYRSRGNAALVTYDNLGSVKASDAFTSLLSDAPYVYPTQRSMIEYLKQYPSGILEGVREVMYWCMDSLKGLKAVLSVNHVLVYAPPEQPGVTVVANKQIYADRYLEAMLDLTAVVDRPSPSGAPAVYLLKLRRMRFDRLSVGFIDIRGKVVKGMREQLVSDLQRIKTTAESTAH